MATGRERHWSFDDRWSGFGGLAWGADNETLHLVPVGEGFGALVSLNTKRDPEGQLTNMVRPVTTGLRDNEWYGVPTQIDLGVFVRIMCNDAGRMSSFVPPCGIGILTNEGLQRLATSVPLDDIRAIDPTGKVIIYGDRGKTYAALVDGSQRRLIETGGYTVSLY